jgi:hypothetical protein
MGLSITIAAGLRQRSHSQVRVLRDSWLHVTVSDSRLTNLEGQVPVFISPRKTVARLYPQTLGPPFSASLWVSYITTDGQSASLSWYQGAYDQIFITVRSLRVFDMGRPLWQEDGSVFYNVQCIIFYCLRFETPPTWRTRSLYLYHPGTGWPAYTPRHWVELDCPSCLLFNFSARTTYNTSPLPL